MELSCGRVKMSTLPSSSGVSTPQRAASQQHVMKLSWCLKDFLEKHHHRKNNREQLFVLPHIYWVLSFSTNTKKPIVSSWVTTLAPEPSMMTPRWCGPSTSPKCRVTASTRKNLRNTRPDTAAQWTCLVSFWPRNVRLWSVMWIISIFCMSGHACPTRMMSSTLGKRMTSRVTWVSLTLVMHVKSRSETCPWVRTSGNGLEFVCVFSIIYNWIFENSFSLVALQFVSKFFFPKSYM